MTPRRRDERGTALPVLLALTVALLGLGGFALDFWRVLGERRTLAAMADAAATAGANGLDEASLRTGGAQLDPALARQLALDQLRREGDARHITNATIVVAGNTVDVTLEGHASFTLLGLVAPGDDDGFTVRAHARAAPQRGP